MKKILTAVITLMLAVGMVVPVSGFAAGNSRTPKIILKMDDLGINDYKVFEKVADYLKSEGIPASFGVIGQWCEGTGAEAENFYNTVKQWSQEGFEIWHHGYTHAEDEFHGRDLEAQAASFQKTMDLMREKCGIEMQTFGSPYNNADETAIQMINERFPQIKTLLLVSDKKEISNGLVLPERAEIEIKTGVVGYDNFVTSYNKKAREPYLVLQGHCGYWDDNSIAEFKRIIEFLKERDAVFMTPTQYNAYYQEQLLNPNPVQYIDVRMNGEYLDFDEDPVMIEDRVLVPFRAVFEKLGATVDFDGATSTATAVSDDTEIKITQDQKTAYINGQPTELDVAATLINDRRFVVPIRFIAEALDRIVYWDEPERTVVIMDRRERQEQLPAGAIPIQDVTFSSYFNDEMGYFSYDGNRDSLWSCEGVGEWICYDLGESQPVSRLSVVWNKGNERQAIFKVSISDDNVNFRDVFEGRGSGTVLNEYEDYELPAGTAGRYVKITCLGNTVSEWNAIKEINIYK